MDYTKFQQLIREKEKPNVDFKIECHAFDSKTKSPRAELARDICAMANNGNVSSFIIIGVSDDGLSFKSVENPKLTDENLQSFCKTAISPPPKIRVFRNKYSKGASIEHKGKEFVIIQIGPHPRCAYRLTQDVISHEEKICYRRNDVWIRRGTTSDLATPEEISRLVNGQYWEASDVEIELEDKRREFSRLSISEQRGLIRISTIILLQGLAFTEVSTDIQMAAFDQQATEDDVISQYIQHYGPPKYFFPLYSKQKGSILIFIYHLGCSASLTKKDFRAFVSVGMFEKEYLAWNWVPKMIPELGRKRFKGIRRIWLLPILSKVPNNRISNVIPECRTSETQLHFYRPFLTQYKYKKSDNKKVWHASSSELLIVDKITSLSEFVDALKDALLEVEKNKDTIVVPMPTDY